MVLKMIYTMFDMSRKFEGQARKRKNYIDKIKNVYFTLLKEQMPLYYEIANSLDFEGKFLRTSGTLFSFELASD